MLCLSRARVYMLACVSLHVALLSGVGKPVSGHEEHLEVANKQVSLRDICANRQVPIISVPEARRLINELKRHPESCPNNYVQSFYELEPILTLGPEDRLCGEHKFEQIRDFHFRYINPLVEAYKTGDDLNHLEGKIVRRPLDVAKVDYTVQLDEYKQEIMIPISLQQFFKAWALQVSGVCKRTLVDNLDKAMQLFTDADFVLIDQAAKEGANGLDLVPGGKQRSISSGSGGSSGSSSDQLAFSQLVYMPRLEGELKPGDAELHEQLTVLDLRSQPELERLMRACKRRFRPIYSKLVLPIVRLSKLGYDYVGPKLDDISHKLDKDADVLRWLAVTRVCEARGNYELLADAAPDEPNGQPEAGSSHANAMEQLEYEPMYNYRADGELWIKGAEALAKELDRINGRSAKGFKKFLFDSGVAGRKMVAFFDPHQFAWYRRNQNTLSSALNLASITSNTVSMIWG